MQADVLGKSADEHSGAAPFHFSSLRIVINGPQHRRDNLILFHTSLYHLERSRK